MSASTTPQRTPAEAMHARDAACRALGIALEESGAGRAVVAVDVTDSMVNGHGTAHGGFVFLLADAAFAAASNGHGPVAVAQTAQIAYLRPARAGDRLTATAVERFREGRTGLYDVTVRRGDGAAVAEFRGQSTMLSGRPDPA